MAFFNASDPNFQLYESLDMASGTSLNSTFMFDLSRNMLTGAIPSFLESSNVPSAVQAAIFLQASLLLRLWSIMSRW